MLSSFIPAWLNPGPNPPGFATFSWLESSSKVRHRGAAFPGEKTHVRCLNFRALKKKKRIDLPHLAGKGRMDSQPRGAAVWKDDTKLNSFSGGDFIDQFGERIVVCPHQHSLPFPSPHTPHPHHSAHTGKSQLHPSAIPLAIPHAGKPAGRLFQTPLELKYNPKAPR